jgi:uncharacterized protein YndB with AHSA1/START domain
VDAKSSEMLVVSRDFDAPAEMVFDAWLDGAVLGKWLFATPDGKMQRVECDPRVGGQFVVAEQRGEDLAEHYGRYAEIDRPNRLVILLSVTKFEDPTENLSRIEIDIVPDHSGCKLTLTHTMDPQWVHMQDRVRVGWTMILDGLSSTLFAEREVVSTRLIAAPRERVYEAFSEPEQLAQWWGPNGFTNTIHEFDLREGGSWKMTMHGPDGVDFRNESVFVTVNPPERIVYDHLRTMHRFLMEMTYFDHDGKTRITWRQRFESVAEYEKVKTFVIPANEQNFDRLEAHLKGEPIS